MCTIAINIGEDDAASSYQCLVKLSDVWLVWKIHCLPALLTNGRKERWLTEMKSWKETQRQDHFFFTLDLDAVV